MTDCIFCKIAEGKIPCAKIYEDKNAIAFLDISPVNKGHTLIAPKKHYENLQAIPEEELCAVMKAVKKIAPAIIRAINAPSFNLIISNGKEAGQEVFHMHVHIIPQSGDKNTQISLPHNKYKAGEIGKTAESIKKNL